MRSSIISDSYVERRYFTRSVPTKNLLAPIALGCFLFLANVSHANCVGYSQEFEFTCVGGGGCQGTYYRVYCTFGCASGTCVNQGGSGECCGKIYYVATIYPDGGWDCNANCGDAPVRRSHVSHPKKSAKALSAALDVIGPVRLTAELSYSIPRTAIVPDRCRRTFEVIEPSETEWARGF